MFFHNLLRLWKSKISHVSPSLDSAPQLSESESRACALEDAEDDELLESSDSQADWGIDLDRKRNRGWDEVTDQDLGEEEDTPLHEAPELDDGWGPPIVYPPHPVKVQLTWTSPLPEISSIAETDSIKVAGENYEFISRFLADDRKGDIPFEQSHGLVNLLLRVVTACAFDTMQRWAPKDLLLMQIQGPDQLELQWWLSLLSDFRYRYPEPAETAGTDWDLLGASIGDWSVGQVRHKAIHRWSYSTRLIKDSVNFLIALNDLERFRQVESTVRVLYGTLSGTFAVTDSETSALTSALQLYPTECRTVLDLYYTIGGILENAYFQCSKTDDQDWLTAHKVTVAEQLELYRPENLAWSSLYPRDDDVSFLRNNVAHRGGSISEVILDLEQIRCFVQDLREVAVSLEDDDAAAQITQVSEAAMVHLQARSAGYEIFLNSLSPQDLRTMSREATERFNKWDPTKLNPDRDIAKHTIAQRYLTASRVFREMAELKDGTAYRDAFSFLNWKTNRAHEGWQMELCKRFEYAKRLLA
ncbi:MAG: hypothetical protein Q9195_007089 [Heterodermia aff. obscurata]